MASMILPLVLIVFKYCVYCVIVFYAAKQLKLEVGSYLRFAIGWGLARLLIGLISGIFIFYSWAQLANSGMSTTQSYLLSFGLARYAEWFILFFLILWLRDRQMDRTAHLFVLLGTIANILMDQLAIAAGLGNLKFVC